jgi:hypothetical protein
MTELTAKRALVAELRCRLRPDQMRTEDLDGFRHDRSGWTPPGAPTAVVSPENTIDVQEILRSANEPAVPVVVRGAGTGLSGTATAVDGELVLSTSRLIAITELSPADQLAVVQRPIDQYRSRYRQRCHRLRPDQPVSKISNEETNKSPENGTTVTIRYANRDKFCDQKSPEQINSAFTPRAASDTADRSTACSQRIFDPSPTEKTVTTYREHRREARDENLRDETIYPTGHTTTWSIFTVIEQKRAPV